MNDSLPGREPNPIDSPHWLDPLLAPRSIAFVGASTRPDSSGNDMVRMAVSGGFEGSIYPVNPKYDEVAGLRCYPSLTALPETVDQVVLAVANSGLEAALEATIQHGARAATIFGSCYLENDTSPELARRLTAIARESSLALCGGNCMGFVNPSIGLRVAAYPCGPARAPGPIVWIAQSGSVFGALAYNDQRLKFTLAVSSGSEFVLRPNDFMDWALHRTSARVIALFLEAVRDPDGFEQALAEAARREIPVVVLKAGRTAESAAMARTHTGAIAGNDAAYRALFAHHGVIRVSTMNELAATLILLSSERRPGPGALGSIHDSGGECELLIDLADDIGVPIAEIGPATKATLAEHLDPGLRPVNPLDAWGTGNESPRIFERCFKALLDDPATALGLMVSDMRDDHWHHRNLYAVALAVAGQTEKPLAFATNYSLVSHRAMALALTEAGVPVLDGTREALEAIKHLLDYRDFLRREPSSPPSAPDEQIGSKWRTRLRDPAPFDEVEGLAMLRDYGIPVAPAVRAASKPEAVRAADSLGYPVVLKSAAPGLEHKSDLDGVRVDLENPAAVAHAYDDIARRLGDQVTVCAMVEGDVEVALGLVNDPQFGPFVLIGAGGRLVEVLDDHTVMMAPVDEARARAGLRDLRLQKLLDGVRGRAPCDVDALGDAIARLSVLGADLRSNLSQLDVNPIIVGPNGCTAVDVLVVGGTPPTPDSDGN